MSDRIMSRQEVAEFIGKQCRPDGKPVCQATITIYQRKGMPHRKFAGRVSFRESAVLKWIERESAI